MGVRHSSSTNPPTSVGAGDRSPSFPSDKLRRCSLNFPRLNASRRGPRKMKTKRNVSATFNINESESAYDSQGSNTQSCLSSVSSNQNVCSSASSAANGSTAVIGNRNGAAVNLIYGEFNTENASLNINTATEEGLMTLPGVSRQMARNIVGYRKLIGGFKNIQDIALVSGVGATLYVRFRSDITCSDVSPEQVNERPGSTRRSTTCRHDRGRSSTLSKHSSTSSSGIDISTINEDDYDVDGDKNHHHHHQSEGNCKPDRSDHDNACHTNDCIFE